MAGPKGERIRGSSRYLYTLLCRTCTILHSRRVRCVCFLMALPAEHTIDLSKFWEYGVKVHLSLLFFPCQTGNLQVTVSEERRSEGKVGLKVYKSYLTAGAHWFIIIFLILLNIAAQVSKDIHFVLWPQLDVYGVTSTVYIYATVTVSLSPLGFALKHAILGNKIT